MQGDKDKRSPRDPPKPSLMLRIIHFENKMLQVYQFNFSVYYLFLWTPNYYLFLPGEKKKGHGLTKLQTTTKTTLVHKYMFCRSKEIWVRNKVREEFCKL